MLAFAFILGGITYILTYFNSIFLTLKGCIIHSWEKKMNKQNRGGNNSSPTVSDSCPLFVYECFTIKTEVMYYVGKTI